MHLVKESQFPAAYKKTAGAICAGCVKPNGFKLLCNLDDNAGADRTAALTDCETQALLNCDRGDQLHIHVDIIAGHAHLNAFGQGDDAGDIGGTEVELRAIVVEERRVTAALVLGQDIDLALELGVRVDGARLTQNLATLDALLVNAAEQQTDIVASLCVVCLLYTSRCV